MEGSARKVITVRSALMVKNRLDVPMEVRLDSPSAPDSKTPLYCIYFQIFKASSFVVVSLNNAIFAIMRV